MNREKPDYLLSDEEVALDDDSDFDPYAEDVVEELDFDQEYAREWERELTIEELEQRDAEERESEADRASMRSAFNSMQEPDIDNNRW